MFISEMVNSTRRARSGAARGRTSEPCRLIHQMDGQLDTVAIDIRIARLAERQHGVIARAQLVALGLGRGAIESRIRRGWLHPVHHGVYAVGYRNLSAREGWMAACWLAAAARCSATGARRHCGTCGARPGRTSTSRFRAAPAGQGVRALPFTAPPVSATSRSPFTTASPSAQSRARCSTSPAISPPDRSNAPSSGP